MTANNVQSNKSQLEIADREKQLLIDMEHETLRTIYLLGMLSEMILNYCPTCKDLDAQSVFYGVQTALSDGHSALESIAKRF